MRMDEDVAKLKADLEKAQKELNWATVPPPVLEDFKMAVDHIRTDIWAAMSTRYTEQYKVAAGIVRFRLKRAAQMCEQIKLDIDAGEVSVDASELKVFHTAVKKSSERIDELYQSGM